MSSRKPSFFSAPRVVYVIAGPSGVYVGCTTDATRRWHTHRLAALNEHKRALPIHAAMQRDGLVAYTFSVVACARNRDDGEATECALIRQLRAAGENVLNVHPRDDRQRSGFGAELVRIRAELGYSQTAFARAANITLAMLWRWETGRGVPSGYGLMSIAPLVGSRIDALVALLATQGANRSPETAHV